MMKMTTNKVFFYDKERYLYENWEWVGNTVTNRHGDVFNLNGKVLDHYLSLSCSHQIRGL